MNEYSILKERVFPLDSLSVREDRVTQKLRYDNGKMYDTVMIPTAMYPTKENKFELFHWENTNEITDKEIISVFDSVKFKIGGCYDNTTALYNAFKSKGIDARMYAGWILFNNEYPAFHSWLVIGNSVLDLSDNDYAICEMMISEKISPQDITRNIYQNLYKRVLGERLNSQQCRPLGKVSYSKVYVGTEWNPHEAKEAYCSLREKHKRQTGKDHPTWIPVMQNGLTPMQSAITKR